MQYIVEQLLINILKAAGQIVKDTTLGPKGGASRATLSYRDLAAVLDTLDVFSCVSVFDGCSAVCRDEGKPDGDSRDDAGKKGKPKPAAKSKAKAKAKAKASPGKGSGRGRGRGTSTGKGSGRGKPTVEEAVRDLQSLYPPMDEEKAKDEGLFAAKYAKEKSDA